MPYACTSGRLIGQFFFFGKILRAMGNAFFLVCNENPIVNEGLANLEKAPKEIRDQACQLITVPALFYEKRLSD